MSFKKTFSSGGKSSSAGSDDCLFFCLFRELFLRNAIILPDMNALLLTTERLDAVAVDVVVVGSVAVVVMTVARAGFLARCRVC